MFDALRQRIPVHVMARDGMLIALAVGVLLWARALQVADSGWAWPSAGLAALLLALAGYLVHEWGHLCGALISRASVILPPGINQAFLFRWDSDRNNRQQFFWMASGGFVASGLTVVVYLVVLDTAFLADRLALILTALGVLATLIIEVPEFLGVARGGPIPNGAAFVAADADQAAAARAPGERSR